MNKLNTFSGTLRKVAGLCNVALFGFPTFWIAFSQEAPNWIKIIAGCLYAITLVVSAFLVFAKDKSGVEDTVRIPDFENRGIVNVAPNYNDITDRFRNARNAIDIIVYHGEHLLDYTKDELIKAINRGVKVRLLVAKKDSNLLHEVWKLENKDVAEESKRVDNAYASIEKIRERTSDNPYRFMDHKYNTQVRYSAIIVDNKWAWWTPYHPGKKVETITSFILTKTGENPIIQDCIDHFDCLWNNT